MCSILRPSSRLRSKPPPPATIPKPSGCCARPPPYRKSASGPSTRTSRARYTTLRSYASARISSTRPSAGTGEPTRLRSPRSTRAIRSSVPLSRTLWTSARRTRFRSGSRRPPGQMTRPRPQNLRPRRSPSRCCRFTGPARRGRLGRSLWPLSAWPSLIAVAFVVQGRGTDRHVRSAPASSEHVLCQ